MIIPAADRIKNVQEYYFSKKLDQIRQLNQQGHRVINLGIGSPDLVPSKETIEASLQSIQAPNSHGYSAYRSTPELRKAIADWYLQTYQVQLNPDSEILPLLGSKEGIHYISMAFLNPGDSVLVPNPGYPAYASISQIVGAKTIYYKLSESNNWWPDFDALENLDLKSVKMMWVNYPNMPTGARAHANLFKKLIAFGHKHGILICHDNPYSLVLNTEKPLSLLQFDPKMEVSLELNSLSKSFNMAGWRVGMLQASAAVIDSVVQVKSNVDSGMFLPIQKAAIQAFKNSQEWHRERNQTYEQRRQVVFKIFDLLNFSYDPKQVGLFVWAKAPEKILNVEKFIDDILENDFVFLTPGFIFGSEGLRYARCSLCATIDQLQEALIRIEKGQLARKVGVL